MQQHNSRNFKREDVRTNLPTMWLNDHHEMNGVSVICKRLHVSLQNRSSHCHIMVRCFCDFKSKRPQQTWVGAGNHLLPWVRSSSVTLSLSRSCSSLSTLDLSSSQLLFSSVMALSWSCMMWVERSTAPSSASANCSSSPCRDWFPSIARSSRVRGPSSSMGLTLSIASRSLTSALLISSSTRPGLSESFLKKLSPKSSVPSSSGNFKSSESSATTWVSSLCAASSVSSFSDVLSDPTFSATSSSLESRSSSFSSSFSSISGSNSSPALLAKNSTQQSASTFLNVVDWRSNHDRKQNPRIDISTRDIWI